MQITHCSPHSILFLQSQFRWCGQGFFSVSPSCIFFNLIIPSFLTLQSLGTPPYLRRICSQCTSSGQKILFYLSFQVRRLRRSFSLLMSLSPSYNQTAVRKIHCYIVGRGFLSQVLGLPLISGSNCMPRLPSVRCGIWPGSWFCSRWHTLLCYTVASLTGIVSRWGYSQIGLIIGDSSW